MLNKSIVLVGFLSLLLASYLGFELALDCFPDSRCTELDAFRGRFWPWAIGLMACDGALALSILKFRLRLSRPQKVCLLVWLILVPTAWFLIDDHARATLDSGQGE